MPAPSHVTGCSLSRAAGAPRPRGLVQARQGVCRHLEPQDGQASWSGTHPPRWAAATRARGLKWRGRGDRAVPALRASSQWLPPPSGPGFLLEVASGQWSSATEGELQENVADRGEDFVDRALSTPRQTAVTNKGKTCVKTYKKCVGHTQRSCGHHLAGREAV